MRKLILIAFFLSGACALVYEVVWTRLLGLVMGNTVYAVSTTLAAFMAGLALGSYVFGKVADRLGRPGRFYGFLEIVIGLYCLVLPFLIEAADPIYSFAYRRISSSPGVLTAIRFMTAGLILLVPATLMGATLPVLSRFYASRREKLGWEVGRLYALNTLGAVFGTLLGGFALLPSLGVDVSLASAAAVNIGLGLGVLAVSRAETPMVPASGSEESAKEREGRPSPVPHFRTVALAFAISGFAALVYEVAWTRIISLLIGPSTYAFALMLSCFLVGLAFGSALAARLIDRWRRYARQIMALLLLGSAVSALALLPALTGAVPHIRDITRDHSQSFLAMYGAYFGLVAVLLILPTTLLGGVFPAAVRAAAPAVGEVGRKVGQLYAANTIGAIAGSVIGGFLLIPHLGLSRAIAAGAAIHLLGALLLFAKGRERSPAVICAVLALAAFIISPDVDHKTLSSGPYKYIYADESNAEQVLESRELLYYKEGVTATVSVTKTGEELALVIDGKVDASLGADMDTQVLLAHLPLLFSPDPRSVLVVGLASGVTLGSVERHPTLETIECVEISPEVIEACAFFTAYNNDALSDPRLNLVVHDARNFLKMTDHSYDVIISEPSNPWMSGASALFTKEFFQSCLGRLKDGGILCQWLQGYSIPTDMLRGVIATFCEVFPHVGIWMPLKGDFILLGSSRPIEIDPVALTRRMSGEAISSDLASIDIERWEELAGMTLGLSPELCAGVADATVQTDSRPLLEFALPKTLHMRIELAAHNLSWLASSLGDAGRLVRDGEDARSRARLSADSYKDYLRGQVSEWAGDSESAIALYRGALRGPAGRRSATGPLYLLMCNRGVELERQRKPEEAERIYEAAIDLAPNRAEAHYLLGLRLLGKGAVEEASVELRAAMAAEPNRVEPALALADVLSQLGLHEEALAIIRHAQSMAPGDARVWYGEARVGARLGDGAMARGALERAITLGGPRMRIRAASDSVLLNADLRLGP